MSYAADIVVHEVMMMADRTLFTPISDRRVEEDVRVVGCTRKQGGINSELNCEDMAMAVENCVIGMEGCDIESVRRQYPGLYL